MLLSISSAGNFQIPLPVARHLQQAGEEDQLYHVQEIIKEKEIKFWHSKLEKHKTTRTIFRD
jgi:hypothetical protein